MVKSRLLTLKKLADSVDESTEKLSHQKFSGEKNCCPLGGNMPVKGSRIAYNAFSAPRTSPNP